MPAPVLWLLGNICYDSNLMGEVQKKTPLLRHKGAPKSHSANVLG